MTYNDYLDFKRCRTAEAVEYIRNYLYECSFQDCGLTNAEKGELSDLLGKLHDACTGE